MRKLISIGVFIAGVAVGAAAASLIAVAYMAIASFLGDWCGDEVLAVAHSPDGTHVATVIERNCGATTPYVRAVFLHEYGEFDLDDKDDAVYVIESQGKIPIRWDDETHLAIGIAGAGGPAFKKSETWRNIAITYGYWYGE